MNARNGWFEVDRAGLARVAGRRTKLFILRELIQNSWDEASSIVSVEVHKPANGSGFSTIRVTDDSPEGFADLSHAYTLFAPSAKVTDAEKRGRFNFGEKLVLALCAEARIETTKGTVLFERGERRRRSPKKREAGSMFEGLIRLNAEEREALVKSARAMIPPVGKRTLVNDEEVFPRTPVAEFRHVLSTEIAKEDGTLRSEYRGTDVRVYEVLLGEKASLYEMGIPVVETGDRWHVDISQKVPLNMERDNVSPAYLQDVRVSVANATRDLLTVADANAPWARDALADYQCKPETARRLASLRFGDRAVIHDPSDQEANQKAAANGYVVVTGSQLSAAEWDRVRESGAMLPAGRVFPTPKAFHEDGSPLKLVAPEDQTTAMARFARFAAEAALALVGWDRLLVVFADKPHWPFAGVIYTEARRLIVNHRADWYEELGSTEQCEFLIHELAHSVEKNHLSEKYHDALCKLGGKLVRLALDRPEVFR